MRFYRNRKYGYRDVRFGSHSSEAMRLAQEIEKCSDGIVANLRKLSKIYEQVARELDKAGDDENAEAAGGRSQDLNILSYQFEKQAKRGLLDEVSLVKEDARNKLL